MSDPLHCTYQCGGRNSAEVIFHYVISCGTQNVPLCMSCAKEWRKTFGNTDAGQSLSIEAIENV